MGPVWDQFGSRIVLFGLFRIVPDCPGLSCSDCSGLFRIVPDCPGLSGKSMWQWSGQLAVEGAKTGVCEDDEVYEGAGGGLEGEYRGSTGGVQEGSPWSEGGVWRRQEVVRKL